MPPIRTHTTTGVLTAVLACSLGAAPSADAQSGASTARDRAPSRDARARPGADVLALRPLVGRPASELVEVVERFTADRSAIVRRHDVRHSAARRARLRECYDGWRARLREIDFGALGVEGRIDWVLLDTRLREELAQLDREERLATQTAEYAPFAAELIELQEHRRRLEPVRPRDAAHRLDRVAKQVDRLRQAVERTMRDSAAADTALAEREATRQRRIIALRSVQLLESVRGTLADWCEHYEGYDPLFSWWVSEPYGRTDRALEKYATAIRERIVGAKDGEEEPIIGDPIGRDALMENLSFELIAYTPEELIAIAERELAWCEAEMRRAAREMGVGDDWLAALEQVKNTYVEPGEQPGLIRELALEAMEYVERHGLVTVPPLAREVWRLEMLSPRAQKVSSFFLGGEVIRVSYPTDSMAHEDKLMSLRGNNPHFSRATVHHELIPGHHLQGYMSARYNAHRRAFATPFWTEGGALYWEMLLWDRGFPRGPEDRVGMLFWRMHRAARIIFSLRFHLGMMSPQEAIDFLVERVGHERANATAEVRRSFNGSYPPLYQIAYMIGALQFRGLRRELVESGRMTDRQFHDAILQGGNMPVEMVRARLTGQRPSRDHGASWRFADPMPGTR